METLENFRNKVCWYDSGADFVISDACHNVFIASIADFAEKMQKRGQSADYYEEKRRASCPKKDIEIGKYGEFSAALILNSGNIVSSKFPILKPDFEVRNGSLKKWDCDLPFSNKDPRLPDCHVKTCDQKTSDFVNRCRDNKYTWTFQYANEYGTGGRDELFFKPDSDEVILFMFVPHFYSKRARIIASAPWNQLQKIIKDPIAKKFKGLKKCIYSNDLLELSNRTPKIIAN